MTSGGLRQVPTPKRGNPDDAGDISRAGHIANSQSGLLSFLAPILLLFGRLRVRAPTRREYRARYYVQSLG